MPGCDVFALAITGLPAAIAAAKSPPLALLNASGKLFGPNTTTGPIGPSSEPVSSNKSPSTSPTHSAQLTQIQRLGPGI